MGHINSELRSGIMRELAVQSTIDPVTEVRRRVDFLKDYLASTPASGFVLGISGGQDSTLTGKLAQRAVTELRADGHEAEFLRPMENDDDENERPRETRTDGCDDEAQVRRTHPRTQASQPGNHDPLPHVNHHEGCGPRG